MADNAGREFPSMRKKKYIMSEEDAWAALASSETSYGFLGVNAEAGGAPYVVPMNFAAEPAARAIYLHTTIDPDSRRNNGIARNPAVSFTVVHPASSVQRDPGGVACKCSMNFVSVMAFGEIAKVEQPAEKARILNFMVRQKAAVENLMEVPEHATVIATIYKIDVRHISGAKKQ